MNQMVSINGHALGVKEFHGQRVVTFRDVDECHERPEGTARHRFNENRKHFIEGEDYFGRNSSEAAKEFGVIAPNGLTLLTESGYLMLVKSFTDDLAWRVQRALVNSYFRVKREEPGCRDEIALLNAQARLLEAQARLLDIRQNSHSEVSNTLMTRVYSPAPRQTANTCHVRIPGVYYQQILEICDCSHRSIIDVTGGLLEKALRDYRS